MSGDKKYELQRSIQERPDETLVNHLLTEKEIQELKQQEKDAELKAQERADIIKMRKHWSTWILVSIIFIVGFDALLIILLGFNFINFEQKYTAPIIVGESTAKMFLLAYVVAKFLFNEKSLPDKNLDKK